jgi:frataxin-like iron-binding protein CyaY
MKQIKLTYKRVALIDDEDYELISKYHWYTDYAKSGLIYARTNSGIRMHRLILSVEDHIDHIDGNGLNNQKLNLRVATYSQNAMNRRKKSHTSSRFKGVHFDSNTGKWRAQIQYKGKTFHMGSFDSEEEAATKYDLAAIDLFGEFARTNFDYDI